YWPAPCKLLTLRTVPARAEPSAPFCASTVTAINRTFRRRESRSRTSSLNNSGFRFRLGDLHRNDPGHAQKQKIHQQKGRETRGRSVFLNQKADPVSDEITRNHQQ